eukprot:TRINITY_DN11841_c0_g1_i1.p1 TRINITY_DN11841_c0_g1~~TRINITY_DN11841_c0_g1_i1.p1  ORF type:complete len:532 (+),score=136.28 TRINITY_DN11841_c0_g1_i1:40-1596(+)
MLLSSSLPPLELDVVLNETLGTTTSSTSSSSSSKGTFKPKPPAPGRPKKKKKGEEDLEEKKDRPNAIRYHCDYCRKDISNVVRIKCAECNDFDLCIECFSVGVEISTHKNNHKYQVIDHMKFTLFSEDWGADEELLLLEAIETYGLGNWTDVADHVGTKTLSQCETHYFNLYFHPSLSSLPLPDLKKLLVVEREPKEVLPQTEPPHLKQKPGASVPIQHEGSGLMAYRAELEVEYENDAEVPLAEMTISMEEDSDQEIELKSKVLLAYNQKLQERYAKRKFVIENVLDVKKRSSHNSHHHYQQHIQLFYPNVPLSKEEKSVYNAHRIFLQLWSRDQHDSFMRGLIAEKQLLEKISEFQNYRSNGITTLTEAASFESDSKKKDNELGKYSYGAGSTSHKWLKREREIPILDNKKKKLNRKMNETNETLKGWIGDSSGTTSKTKANDNSWGLLSQAEIELCTTIRVQWDQYLIIKEALLREYLKHGSIKKSNARQLSKIDVNKMNCIFDYLESAGIINSN